MQKVIESKIYQFMKYLLILMLQSDKVYVRFINLLYEQVVLYRRRLFAEDVECEETWTEFCVCYRGNDAIREAD